MSRLVRVSVALVAILVGSTVPTQALEDVRGWRHTTWRMTEPPTGSREDDREKILGLGLLRLLGGTRRRSAELRGDVDGL